MNKQTKFILDVAEDAAGFLIASGGDYQRARRSALKLIMNFSRPGTLYHMRRHYCAVYIHLLINEPAPKFLPHFSTLNNTNVPRTK